MKRIFSLLVTLVIVSNISAQQHLSFMGVQMGKDIDTFIKQLSSKGLKTINCGKHTYGTDNDEAWCTLSGQFWKFEDTSILVKAPFADKGVSIVQVGSCRGNRQTYSALISQTDKKYGKHSTAINVRYANDRECIWKTSMGEVRIWRSVFSDEDAQCNIEIEYIDITHLKRNLSRQQGHENDL